MRFCSSCGAELELRVPAGDDRTRHCCTRCGEIHYVNPQVVVACIVAHEDQVLLCRRAIEPRMGYWSLPGGFMECGETTAAAAAREVLEEAGVQVRIDGFYAICEEPTVSQVYVIYRGRAHDRRIVPGPEIHDAAWYTENQIPWDLLTYPLMGEILTHFFADRMAARSFPVRFSSRPAADSRGRHPQNDIPAVLRHRVRGQHFLHLREALDGYL
jgi:ADP-ribose pyrophosphatase YjhB (NUDIX family)